MQDGGVVTVAMISRDACKTSIKVDISRPEIQVQMNDCAEARCQGLALGNYCTQLLLQALHRNIGTITVAKMWTVVQVYADVLNKMYQ